MSMLNPWYLADSISTVILCDSCYRARVGRRDDLQRCTNASAVSRSRERTATCEDCGLQRYQRRK